LLIRRKTVVKNLLEIEAQLNHELGIKIVYLKEKIKNAESAGDVEEVLKTISDFHDFMNRFRNCSLGKYFDEDIHKVIKSLNPKRFDTDHLLKEKKSFNIAFVFSRFNDSGGAAFTHRCILEKYKSDKYKVKQFILVTNNANEREYKDKERYQYLKNNIEYERFCFMDPNNSLVEKGKFIQEWIYDNNIDFVVFQPDLPTLFAMNSRPALFSMSFSADWHVFTVGPGLGDMTLTMTSDQIYKYKFEEKDKNEVLKNIMLPLPPLDFVDRQVPIARAVIGVPKDVVLSGTTNIWKCSLGDSETLLNGIASLMRKFNNYHHLFIGTPRGLDNIEYFLAKNSDLRDRFHFSGVVPHIFTILKTLDFYINSFPVSGASNTEAGLCGLPSIDLYNDRDMTGHGTELLRTLECEASNLQEFVNIGGKFINDPDYRKELGEFIKYKVSRDLAKERIVKDRIYDTFIKLFFEKVNTQEKLPTLDHKRTSVYEKAISLYKMVIDKEWELDKKICFLGDLQKTFPDKAFAWLKQLEIAATRDDMQVVMDKAPVDILLDYRWHFILAQKYYEFNETKNAIKSAKESYNKTIFDVKPLLLIMKLSDEKLSSYEGSLLDKKINLSLNEIHNKLESFVNDKSYFYNY
jgi:glycosyltransferase involved in cell wall biosynthesis